jgi:predicted DNA-binding transcriptional regulator AlpA
MNYLSLKELQTKFSVSRQTVWEWRKYHNFPKPYSLGGVQRWKEKEVDAWANEQARQTA